jgi:hypothetical protein
MQFRQDDRIFRRNRIMDNCNGFGAAKTARLAINKIGETVSEPKSRDERPARPTRGRFFDRITGFAGGAGLCY